MKYRILIIEPDEARSEAWSAALVLAGARHGLQLSVHSSRSVAAAQALVTREACSLLIAQLGPDQLVFARRVRERWPRTRALLLHSPEAPAAALRAAQTLGHSLAPQPLSEAALVAAAGAALGLPLEATASDDTRPVAALADVQLLLDVLRRQTQAQLAIYTDYIGNTITQRGDAGDLDLSAITSLIAGSFVNSRELGLALRDPETRHLSVLEGAHFDVYATNAGSQRLLALVFAKEFVDPRLGYVWLLLKRGAVQLSKMRLAEADLAATLADELGASLNSEFDRLFGGDLFDPTDSG